VDGQRFEIGGLKGQPDFGYLDPRWLDQLTAARDAFQLTGTRVEKPAARYEWKPNRNAPRAPWPPRGVTLVATFEPPESAKERYQGLRVSVHYELYEGLPVLAKWLTLTNGTSRVVELGSVESEILAVTEQERRRLHVESDFAFAGMDTTHWGPDREYTSQVDYELQAPCC
jgi:hypothetical protein